METIMLARMLFISTLLALPSCRRAPGKSTVEVPSPVQITQFYVSSPQLGKGEKGLLCYGVRNAASLSLDPPVDRVWPSVTRCLEIHPDRNTHYVLTAIGKEGSRASATADVEVGPPAPSIEYLWVSEQTIKRGAKVKVCVKYAHADRVLIEPGTPVRSPVPAQQCIEDAPRASTNYEAVVVGWAGKQDNGSVRVTVRD